jgi:hypothetical protein
MHTEINFIKEQIQEILQRLAAAEYSQQKTNLLIGDILFSIQSINQLPKACSKCGRDPDEVEACSVESCPVGLYKRP